MLRIQLVIEDYGDLIGLQTMLKKVGFDVDATQSAVGLTDQIVNFNPEIVIMTGFGRKIAGFELAKQLRRQRGLPHVVLLHDPARTPEVDPAVTAWQAMPGDHARLLGVIAELTQQNEVVLQEKYARFRRGQSEDAAANPAAAPGARADQPAEAEPTGVFGQLPPSTMADEERRARYKTFLKAEAPPSHGFTAKLVREQVRDLRKSEDEAGLRDLERERREFVNQLFRKRG